MLKKKKAQSTLEYIIIFALVIVAVFAVAYKTLAPAVKGLVNKSADRVTTAGNRFGTIPVDER